MLDTNTPGLDFVMLFPQYIYSRFRSISIILNVVLDLMLSHFSSFKGRVVSRMFWGRGSLYRSSFHVLMVTITVFAIATGVASQVLAVNSGSQTLGEQYAQGPTDDLLQQGSSIQSVLATSPFEPAVKIYDHVVSRGETLSGIARQYGVAVDTIRWANSDLISPFSQEIIPGWELRVPEMDGVLRKVEKGQDLDDVVAEYGGHPIDIIELNELEGPHYKLKAGQELFIPNGEVPIQQVPTVVDLPVGVFKNPLSHPNCAGYSFSRGFTGYHQGVDLAKYPGCPIRAVAAGEVIYAGWSPLAGFNVQIDHGGGIVTKYFHGDGTFWVKVGQRVQQGDEIMMMGTSGNSTGVHLHLSLIKDGYAINPYPYIPY